MISFPQQQRVRWVEASPRRTQGRRKVPVRQTATWGGEGAGQGPPLRWVRPPFVGRHDRYCAFDDRLRAASLVLATAPAHRTAGGRGVKNEGLYDWSAHQACRMCGSGCTAPPTSRTVISGMQRMRRSPVWPPHETTGLNGRSIILDAVIPRSPLHRERGHATGMVAVALVALVYLAPGEAMAA